MGRGYSTINIGGGDNKKKIIIVIVILAICYYIFYYSQNKELTWYDVQTFIGNTLFGVALQNTPFILL